MSMDVDVYLEVTTVTRTEVRRSFDKEMRVEAINMCEYTVSIHSDTIHPDDGYRSGLCTWHPCFM